jgi:hypothetical protein
VAVVLSLALSQVGGLAQAATTHLADAQQVAARLAERAAAREAQVKQVEEALASEAAGQQAKAMGLSLGKMRAALPHLSDSELADLSQRATHVKDLAAGHHNDDGLVILGVILLLAGLAILVAVNDGSTYYDDCGCYY